jgi:hypothetical protein
MRNIAFLLAFIPSIAFGQLYIDQLNVNQSESIGKGGPAAPSAVLDMVSVTQGALFPRMTATQMNAIVSPATGLVVFNTTAGTLYNYNGSAWASAGAGSYVTALTVASSNGFAGTSSGGTTPALTLTTSVTGVLKGNGTAISAATSGTDYVIPSGNITGSSGSFTGSLAGDVTGSQGATAVGKINGTSLAGLTTGILKNTTSTGVPSIAIASDFPTLNQNTSGTAAGLSVTLVTGSGGTGQTSLNSTVETTLYETIATTLGDLVYGAASGAPTRLAGNTTTTREFLTSAGSAGAATAPTWGALVSGDIPSNAANTSGTAAGLSTKLAVASGGTNLTAGTSGGILGYTATGTLASSALLAQFGVVLGGGAGATPTTLTPNASTAFPLVSGGASANPSWAGLTIAGGGTSVTSVTTAPAATAFAGWDANKNLNANSYVPLSTTTVTSAATLTLTVGSAMYQEATGSTASFIYKLPVASTMATGQQFIITNNSSVTITVQTSGLNTVQAMVAGTQLNITCSNTGGGTGTASWTWIYSSTNASLPGGTGTVTSVTFTGDGTVLSSTPSSAVTTSGTVTAALATQTKNLFLAGPTSGSAAAPTFRAFNRADFTSPTMSVATTGAATGGFSGGTYTTPAGVLYFRIRISGAGGGGGSSGTVCGTAAGVGGSSTFGGLTAGGGAAGVCNSNLSAVGGSASGTLTGATTVLAWAGGSGGLGTPYTNTAADYSTGGAGGANNLGGGGGGSVNQSPGGAVTNNGSGGSGGGSSSTAASAPGSGGGAGAYQEAIVQTPSATYAYTVGSGGTASGAGVNGFAGVAGSGGIIIIDEFYQ